MHSGQVVDGNALQFAFSFAAFREMLLTLELNLDVNLSIAGRRVESFLLWFCAAALILCPCSLLRVWIEREREMYGSGRWLLRHCYRSNPPPPPLRRPRSNELSCPAALVEFPAAWCVTVVDSILIPPHFPHPPALLFVYLPPDGMRFAFAVYVCVFICTCTCLLFASRF